MGDCCFNADAGWAARARFVMRKPTASARHPSPPTPPKLETMSKRLTAFAPANTIEIQEITYVILGRPRGRE
jgi:hypothetical protein